MAEVDVGIVTGRNSFFTLSDEQVRALGLGAYVRPLVSRSAQLSGVAYDADCRSQALASNLRTWILDAPKDLDGHEVLSEYVEAGERHGVLTGNRCANRKQWSEPTTMWVPDAFLLLQIHHAPRVTANH